jgi:hypothetical protein
MHPDQQTVQLLAVGVTFPLVSGTVFATSRGLAAVFFPEMQDAWAH